MAFEELSEIFIFEHLIFGQIAQSVEQWTENPCVGGSIPSLPTFIEADTDSLLF